MTEAEALMKIADVIQTLGFVISIAGLALVIAIVGLHFKK